MSSSISLLSKQRTIAAGVSCIPASHGCFTLLLHAGCCLTSCCCRCVHSRVPRCCPAAVPACCQEQLAGLAMINPEEFLESLAPGVRARVEALQVRPLMQVPAAAAAAFCPASLTGALLMLVQALPQTFDSECARVLAYACLGCVVRVFDWVSRCRWQCL